MSDAGDPHGPGGLNLLLFSVGGVRFGIDADQVEGTFSCRDQEPADLLWFHRELEYGDDTVIYGDPVVLGIRTGESAPCRLVIDMMETVAEVAATDIHPFPPLMEPFSLRKGMWGVVVRDEGMILLVDILRLLKGKQGPADPLGDGTP